VFIYKRWVKTVFMYLNTGCWLKLVSCTYIQGVDFTVEINLWSSVVKSVTQANCTVYFSFSSFIFPAAKEFAVPLLVTAITKALLFGSL